MDVFGMQRWRFAETKGQSQRTQSLFFFRMWNMVPMRSTLPCTRRNDSYSDTSKRSTRLFCGSELSSSQYPHSRLTFTSLSSVLGQVQHSIA